MAGIILTVVEDLIFLSKIQQAAQLLSVHVKPVAPSQLAEEIRQSPTQAVIVDLNHRSGAAVEVVRALKADPATRHIPIVGFVSHVQTDVATAAQEAQCDIVLARSAFTQQLPQLLQKLSAVPPR